MNLWSIFLFKPIFNLLIALYYLLGNFGAAILALTLLIRGVLLPVTLPTLRAAKKQRTVLPELTKLKKKYAGDKTQLAQKQLELYRRHGINPAAGCLPQIVQILVLIALYQAFIRILGSGNREAADPTTLNALLYSFLPSFREGVPLVTKLGYLDLAQPDPYYILPVLAGAAQLLFSRLLLPQVGKMESLAKKTETPTDDILYNMQGQMQYMMPLMTVFIGLRLPSGLVLYWLATTVFSLVTQWQVSKR